MKYRPYPEYRESDVKWLGEIPAGWHARRLKRHLVGNDSGVWGDDPIGDDGTVVLRSTDQTIDGKWNVEGPARRRLTWSERREATLATGDLVITKSSGSALHIGKTTFVTPEIEALDCCFSNFMQRIRCKPGLHPKLVFHVLNSRMGREQLDYLSSTTTGLANLNGNVIGNIFLAVPPPDEQSPIAAFLDRETAKVDSLVAKKERLIELLHEKRTALISRVVTKGLDPSVPMKDSGVDWLGPIPTPWTVTPAMRLTALGRPIMYGIVLPGPNVQDGVPIVKGGDVAPGGLRRDSLDRTTFEIEAGHVHSRLRGGDVVYAIRGSIGAAEIVPDELEGANLTQDAARISPASGFNAVWLLFALRSRPVFAQLEGRATGATIRGINIRDLKRACIPVPPRIEQDAIAAFLDCETAKIDALIAKVGEAIELLKEYRTALVSAAVTGKIDVRREGAGEPLLKVPARSFISGHPK